MDVYSLEKPSIQKHPSHFINSFIPLTFIKCLPCAMHCPTNCGFSHEHRRSKSLLSWDSDSSASCLFFKPYILFLIHFTSMHSVVLSATRNPDLYIAAGEKEPSSNMHWNFRAIYTHTSKSMIKTVQRNIINPRKVFVFYGTLLQ